MNTRYSEEATCDTGSRSTPASCPFIIPSELSKTATIAASGLKRIAVSHPRIAVASMMTLLRCALTERIPYPGYAGSITPLLPRSSNEAQ
jgi:hypothetical protein